MRQGGTHGVSIGRRSTTPQSSPKHSSPQRSSGVGVADFDSPLLQIDPYSVTRDQNLIASPQPADGAFTEQAHPEVAASDSYIHSEIPQNSNYSSTSPSRQTYDGTAASVAPSECWKLFASLVEENGIDERDIGELQWASVERICVHLGISDPFMIAEIQKDWRRRHTGTDNPPPMQLTATLPFVPVPVSVPVPEPVVAVPEVSTYVEPIRTPFTVDPYHITDNPFLRGVPSIPIGTPLAHISSPQHKGPIILSEPTPDWSRVKSRIDTGKKRKKP